jgi:hypothetical protein
MKSSTKLFLVISLTYVVGFIVAFKDFPVIIVMIIAFLAGISIENILKWINQQDKKE